MESQTARIIRQTDFSDRRVFAAACDSYDIDLLDKTVEQQCEAMGLSELIRPGSRVVIKPNLVIKRSPQEATTTHPAVIAAVVRAVKRRGGKVLIAESPGGLYNKPAMTSIYSVCGISDMCEREGAELNWDFSCRTVGHPEAVLCRQFDIITPVVEADLLISIAKLKTHCMTGLSGAVKNLFGCVPGLTKPEMHCQYPDKSQFQQMIVDLCTLVCPAFSFIDAIDCMEGDGPSGGSKRFVGALLAGKNPFAVDICACKLIDIEPKSIYMLAHGMERGLCPESFDSLDIIGDAGGLCIKDFKKPRSKDVDFLDFLPDFLRPVAKKAEHVISPRPVIRKNKCVGCGKCAESCPQHTIELKGGKAHINSSGCIRCYCCHEMCPIRAIDIRRTFIWRF